MEQKGRNQKTRNEFGTSVDT